MDLGDVVKFLVVLLVVIVPAISQIVAKIRESQKPPAPPARAPKAPQPAEQTFKDEIEEFLRRAAEAQKPAPAGQTRTDPSPPRTRPARPPSAPKAAPKPAETANANATVVDHVQKHLDTNEFNRRTTQLGAEVAEADDKIDARQHQVFEHQLSQFDWRTAAELEAAGVTSQPAAATSAAGLLPLLMNPETLRQAIVLNEILQRPEDRW